MASKAALSWARVDILNLYRNILRAHRALPAMHRNLGDRYVKDEWHRHKSSAAQYVPIHTTTRTLPSTVVSATRRC
jgi:hypothetical protein